MTKFPDLFAALAEPFDKDDVKTRSGSGRTLSYITARTAMNRLDDVLGPENWWDDYETFSNGHGVKCSLTIRLPDGSTVTKTGIGGTTEMHDPSDTDKTGESDALKRAAVKFGIARHLYRDGVPDFVAERCPPEASGNGHGRDDMPSQARYQSAPEHDRERPHGQQPQHRSGNGGDGRKPTSGRALFAWVKDQEQKSDVRLLQYLNGWAKLHDLPARMVDWDAMQVEIAYAEAMRKLSGSRQHEDASAN